MNKYFIGVIGLIIVVGIGLFYIAHNQDKSGTDFALQQQCAEQAQLFADNYGVDRDWEDVINHYNPDLNKCFVLIKRGLIHHDNIYSEELFDAVEQKRYGSFAVGIPTYGKPIECNVLDKFCESRDEWDAFVKTYME